MYTIGNPLIAQTMIRYDLGAGLNVPIRLMIYEDASGKSGWPTTCRHRSISRLRNEEVTTAANAVHAKLGALAELATGPAAKVRGHHCPSHPRPPSA